MNFNIISREFEALNQSEKKLAIAGSDGDLNWFDFQKKVIAKKEILQTLNIPKGHPIIIYGHKQLDMVISVVACIMLELPYIPIDVVVPIDRIEKIKNITGCNVLINCSEDKIDIEFPIVIRKESINKITEPNFTNNTYYYPNDPIVYIIFTSGSTGEPKGVQITRSAAATFLDWMSNDFQFNSEDVFINQAPFSFDLSVFELFTFLYMGSSIILNTLEITKTHTQFIERIKKYKGSIWVSTPSFAYMYLTSPEFNGIELPYIKHFLFCGEALPKRTASLLLDAFSNAKVINTYGPTEATVATTIVDVTKEVLKKYKDMPVGYSKRNSYLLIDNDTKNPSELGEIVIIGDNVTIGYFNNPELNSQKCFTHNGMRAFRTGDFGFMLDDMLFFGGRKDEQVKLNGYRIELGDITAQIQSIDFIKDAVTIPLKRLEVVKKIISFVTLKDGQKIVNYPIEIQSVLSKKLPAYMIPSEIIVLRELPVSNNHKIDKLKLTELYINDDLASLK